MFSPKSFRDLNSEQLTRQQKTNRAKRISQLSLRDRVWIFSRDVSHFNSSSGSRGEPFSFVYHSREQKPVQESNKHLFLVSIIRSSHSDTIVELFKIKSISFHFQRASGTIERWCAGRGSHCTSRLSLPRFWLFWPSAWIYTRFSVILGILFAFADSRLGRKVWQ